MIANNIKYHLNHDINIFSSITSVNRGNCDDIC